ncbi:MAG TPA: hypothetical protein VLI90_07840 [Tepidisphaeraceae bacterium]|nr:hypothetical protein [Tepidisphaeraceae bacterium]
MAAIITSHMARKDAAASTHVCPGMRIHIIDIVQPPGIGIPRIAGMDAHEVIVSATLIANSKEEMPTNARFQVRSGGTAGPTLRDMRHLKSVGRQLG